MFLASPGGGAGSQFRLKYLLTRMMPLFRLPLVLYCIKYTCTCELRPRRFWVRYCKRRWQVVQYINSKNFFIFYCVNHYHIAWQSPTISLRLSTHSLLPHLTRSKLAPKTSSLLVRDSCCVIDGHSSLFATLDTNNLSPPLHENNHPAPPAGTKVTIFIITRLPFLMNRSLDTHTHHAAEGTPRAALTVLHSTGVG